MQNNKFHTKDSILDGIDFEELIITIQSNEQEVTISTIERVFEDLLKMKLDDARHILKQNMANILKEV